MMKDGKSINTIYFGGEKFAKSTKDDEDALAKYKKMKAFIGTQVYVRTTDSITDIGISLVGNIQNIKPQKDGYVSVIEIGWDGNDGVDLIGWMDVYYDVDNSGVFSDESYNDLCIVDSESINL